MKNTKFTKIALLILSVALLVGAAFAVSTSATETPTEEEILSDMKVNLKYGDMLYFLCLVDAENLGPDADVRFTLYKDADCTDVAATVKAEYLEEGDVKLGTDPVYNTGYYADFASFGVSATFMGVDYYVKATIVKADGDVEGEAVKCSVIKYLLERLYEDNPTDLQKEHYENTIAYGSTAQKVTGDKKTNVADYCYVGANGGEVLVDGVSVGSSAILAKGETFTLKTTEALPSGNIALWKDAAGNSIKGAATVTASASGIYGYTLLPMLTFDGMNDATVTISSSSNVFTTFGSEYAAYNKAFRIYNGTATKNPPASSIVNEKLVINSDDGSDYIRFFPTYTEEGYNHVTFEADLTINGTGLMYPVLYESNASSTVFQMKNLSYNASTGEFQFAPTNASDSAGSTIKTTLPTEGENAHTVNLKIDLYDLDGDVLILFYLNGTLSYICDSRLVTDENVTLNFNYKNTDGVPMSAYYGTYNIKTEGKETPFTKFSILNINTHGDFKGTISIDNVMFMQTKTNEIPDVNTTRK